MTRRKKILLVVAPIAALAIGIGVWLWHSSRPEQGAKALLQEYHHRHDQPGVVRQWLVRKGFLHDRDPQIESTRIVARLGRLGDPGFNALLEIVADALNDTRPSGYEGKSVLELSRPAGQAVPRLLRVIANPETPAHIRMAATYAVVATVAIANLPDQASQRLQVAGWDGGEMPLFVFAFIDRHLRPEKDRKLDCESAVLRELAPRAIPWLVQELKEWPILAALALGFIGHDLRDARSGPILPAIAPLVSALSAKHDEVKRAVIYALGDIGPVSDEVLSALRKMLADEDWVSRQAAINALGTFGPKAKAAFPDILAALKDKDTSVRWASALCLARIGIPSAEVVSGLTEALKDGDPGVRHAAAWALEKLKAAKPPSEGGSPG